jgi:phosphotransferase system  glucose/maltose/N-acetylglucosamine-specific IIC component
MVYTAAVAYVIFSFISLAINGLFKNTPVSIGLTVFFLFIQGIIVNYLCSIGLSLFIWIAIIAYFGMLIFSKLAEKPQEKEEEKSKKHKKTKKTK